MKKYYLPLLTGLFSTCVFAQINIPGMNTIGSPVKVLDSNTNINNYINGARTIQTTDSNGNTQTVVSPIPGVYIQNPTNTIPGQNVTNNTMNIGVPSNNVGGTGTTNTNNSLDNIQSGAAQTIKVGGQSNAQALADAKKNEEQVKEKDSINEKETTTPQLPNFTQNQNILGQTTSPTQGQAKKRVGSQVEIEVKNIVLPMSSWNTTTIDEFEKQGREKLEKLAQ